MKEDYGKIPPQAIEVEASVLGQLMVDSNAFDDISDILKSDMFYKEYHATIFNAICELKKKNIEIDIISVTNRLKEIGEIEKIGGVTTIVNLIENVSSAANIEYHCRILLDMYNRRQIIKVSDENKSNAYDLTKDTNQVLDKFQSDVLNISSDADKRKESSISEILGKFNYKINKKEQEKTFVPTPFKSINKTLNGFCNSEFIVIGSRPRHGKTALAVFMTVEMAKQGYAVAYFSLEMSKEQILLRMIAKESEIPVKKLEIMNKYNNELTTEEWNRYYKAVDIIDKLPIYIEDNPSLSYMQFNSKARRMKRKHNIKICFIDYLQLMMSENSKDEDYTRVTKVSRNTKMIALDLDLPVVALAQVSRDIDKRPKERQVPVLSDLRDSGAIEQDANVILFWANFDVIGLEEFNGENVKSKGILDIAKARSGGDTAKLIYVSGDRMRYTDNVNEQEELPF